MSFGRLKSSAPSITGFTLCLDWGAAVTWTAVLHLVAGAARCLYKEFEGRDMGRVMNDGRASEGSPPRAAGGTVMLTRRSLLAVSAASLFAAGDAAAQDGPPRPGRATVPFGPAGGASILGPIGG